MSEITRIMLAAAIGTYVIRQFNLGFVLQEHLPASSSPAVNAAIQAGAAGVTAAAVYWALGKV